MVLMSVSFGLGGWGLLGARARGECRFSFFLVLLESRAPREPRD